MRTLRVLIMLPLFLLLASGCGSIPDNVTINVVEATQDVGKIVQSTFQALTAQAVSQATSTALPPTPSSTTGSISGTLNYPADSLPAMYVTAYDVGSKNYQYVITKAGQDTYEINGLPPGTYHIVAYTVGGGAFPAGLSGGYTQAVPCGLSANCTDHSLIDVSLAAGQSVTGANPADWYAPQGTFPVLPAVAAVPTSSTPAATTLPPATADGSIAGNLMYPASAIPSLRIVAFQVGSSDYFYIDTAAGQSSYELDHVPPGTYHVVAYVLPGGGFTAGLAGGYSQMVPCGLQAGCNDHTLIDVVVTPAHVTTGINPTDFYAAAGAFPADPVP